MTAAPVPVQPGTTPETANPVLIVEQQYQASVTLYRSTTPGEVLDALLHFARIPFQRASLALIDLEQDTSAFSMGEQMQVSGDWQVREVIVHTPGTGSQPADHARLLSSYPAYEALAALELLQVTDLAHDPFLTPDEREALTGRGIGGLIVVPIVARQYLIGMVEILQETPTPLGFERMRALRRLADQAAIVVQNRSLLQAADQRNAELAMRVRVLEIVNQMAEHITEYEDERALYQLATEAMVKALDIDHCGLLWLEPGPRMGEVVAEYPVQLPPGTILDMSDNPLLEAVERGDEVPLVVSDTRTDPRILPDTRAVFQRLGILSIMMAPVYLNNRIIASLGFDSYQPTRRFSRADALLAVTFATQLGVSIQSVRLLEAERRTRAELARQVRTLETLNQLATQLTRFKEESALLEFAARATSGALRADHCSVMVFDEYLEVGTIVAEYPEGTLTGVQIPLGGNLFVDEIRRDPSGPVIIASVAHDPRLSDTTRAALEASDIHSLIIAPILVDDELYGSIGFDLIGSGESFSPESAQIAQTMAAQLGIGIENIRLLRTAEQRAQEMSRRANNEALINTLTDQMQRAQSVDVMIDTAVEEIGRAIGARRARVRILAEGERILAGRDAPALLDGASAGEGE
jgi:GAF domain-containing protein